MSCAEKKSDEESAEASASILSSGMEKNDDVSADDASVLTLDTNSVSNSLTSKSISSIGVEKIDSYELASTFSTEDSDCLFSEKYLKLNILNGANQIVCCQIFQITHLTFRKDISFECDAVLDRITFQLWIDFANGKLPALLIPNHFDIDSTKFYRGAELEISKRQDVLDTLTFSIYCDGGHGVVEIFLTHLTKLWLKEDYSKIKGENLTKTTVMYNNRTFLLNVLTFLDNSSNTSTIFQLCDPMNDFGKKNASSNKDSSSFVKEVLRSTLLTKGLVVLPVISLNHCSYSNDQLGFLMRSTRSLLAVACGIRIVDLWRAMVYSDDTELTIENLEIGYNPVMEYDDFDCSEFRDTFDIKKCEPWEIVCCWIMTKSPHLKSVDFSFCWDDTEEQATAFCNGLLVALRRRHQAGLSPLDSLVMKKLQTKYHGIYNRFITNISSEFTLNIK